MGAECSVDPPFYTMNKYNCIERMYELIHKDFQEIKDIRQASFDYFNEYLNPVRLANLLLEKYK